MQLKRLMSLFLEMLSYGCGVSSLKDCPMLNSGTTFQSNLSERKLIYIIYVYILQELWCYPRRGFYSHTIRSSNISGKVCALVHTACTSKVQE